ncbi:flippase [Sphingobium aquiterrae]|uniref:flippase n=1 Tax=Sphingobium aquiterrae TaxID=2038656 RepID=UPI003016EA12
MRKSFDAILFYVLTAFLPLILAVVTVPHLISTLGIEKFGYLSLIWVLIGYFSIFDLGLGRVLTREVSVCLAKGHDFQIYGTVRSILSLMSGLALIGAVSVILISFTNVYRLLNVADKDIADVTAAIRWLALGVPAVIFFSAARGLLEAFGYFKLAASLRAIVGGWAFAGPAVAAAYVPSLSFAVFAISIIRFAILIIPVAVLYRHFRNHGYFAGERWVSPTGALRMAGWMTVSNTVSPLMVYFDRFIVSSISGPASVAYYSTPYDIISRISIVPEAIFSVIFPKSAREHATNESFQKKTHLVCELILGVFMALVSAGVIMFGEQILALWVGQAFADKSWQILIILSGGLVFNFISRASFNTLQAAGHVRSTATVHLIELPVYLIVLYALIHWYGLLGVAYAWAIRACLDMLLLRNFLSHKVSADLRRPFVDIAAIIFFAMAVAGSMLENPIWRMALGGLAGCLVCAVGVAAARRLALWPAISAKREILT